MKARSQSSGRPSHCPNDGEVLADCGWARSTQLAASGEDSRGIVSFDRECLAIVVERRITAQDVIDQLFNLLVLRGIPEHIRSDNGPEFTARKVRGWLNHLGVKTLFIEPGSPWENGYIESFNGKLRDELLNREIFTTLIEAQVLIADWRKEYNQFRPHSSLHYKPPAPEAKMIATLTP